MKSDNEYTIIFILLGCIPTVWLGLIIAPYIGTGMINNLVSLTSAINNPFHIELCSDSFRSVGIMLVLYASGIAIYYSTKGNYREGHEYGSAKWGNVKRINKKYAKRNQFKNKILSMNMKFSLARNKYNINLHSIIIGGSGSGKTRFYAKPNIMQCNTSFIVLDPKGELVADLGHLLISKGYVIKVFDLINMEKSHCYNPFDYLVEDTDVLIMITNLIRNTTPKEAQTQDPFWEKSEMALLQALCLYLFREAPKDEQNFSMVMEMISAAEVKEDYEDYKSPLDLLFIELDKRNPNTLASKQYRIFKQAAGKTAKSILISAGVRLAPFNIDKVHGITNVDEMELRMTGKRKTAIFAVIPDNDKTYNFLVGMLYTQLFQTLYYESNKLKDKVLEVQVHFVMDEFANVKLPEDFESLLSTMRSRGVFVSIILQNLSQLKALYKDHWESIVGNCDQTIYLGGNEGSTHKYISEYVGKETLDVKSYTKSTGTSGSYSTNYQKIARDLITPDEARLLKSDETLVYIRGELAYIDKKYDLMKHPNIKETRDGGAPMYEHGEAKYYIEKWHTIMLTDNEYELYAEEDMEEYFKKIEKNNRRTK